jgi:hypothetical protein
MEALMGKIRLAAATAVVGLLTNIAAPAAMPLPKDIAMGGAGSLLQKVHSVHEAREKLDRLGYYNIHTERASVPYSFIACKRGVRYHIHINYYGDFEQVDPVGACRSYGYGYGRGDYEDRPYFAPRLRLRPYRRYDY